MIGEPRPSASRRRTGAAAAAVALTTLLAAVADADSPPPAAATDGALAPRCAAIRTAALRAHVTFLADDLLEGRGTGTRGHEVAARYVAAQLAAAGLEPGAGGEWFQQVPLRRGNLDGSRIELTSEGGRRTTLAGGSDYVTAATRPLVDVEAPVVFVGHGISAPAAGRDDYAGIDARGAVVAFLDGVPAGLPAALASRYDDPAEKTRDALDHGAVAVLRLWTAEQERLGPWETVVRSLGSGESLSWLEDGAPHGMLPGLRGSAWLGPQATSVLLGVSAGATDGTADMRPRRLAVRAHLVTRAHSTDLHSPNVVGLWRGADPALRDEYVVVSAHLDHLGIGPPVGGDAIYNGAVDNASGVASLLEVARAVAAQPRRPRRSLLFLATTGEEAGVLGAEYFLHQPPVQRAGIVANLNLDGGAVWPFDGLVGRGAEHSTLDASLAAAAVAGVPVAADPMPERFTGSDQFAFVKAGVPALLLTSARSGTARAQAIDWFRNRFHAPSDDLAQPLDFDAAARFTRAVLAVVVAVADAERPPEWKPGSPFAPAATPR